MALWTIGDLHLSFGSDKPMDVFGGRWRGHTEKLKNFWQANVADTDTVVLVGDLSWAVGFEELLPDLSFLQRLPGRIILLKGNHDYWWQTLKKMTDYFADHGMDQFRFLQNNCYLYGDIALCGTRGWSFDGENAPKMIARECGRLEMSLQSAPKEAEKIVFMHFPPVLRETEITPFVQVMRQYGVKSCFYGHLHGKSIQNAVCGEHFGIKFSLVSSDSLDFSLYNILK